MNEQPPKASRPVSFAKTATVFGILLLAAYAVVGLMLTHDRRQGPALEHLEEATAVGVPAVYQLPEQAEGDDGTLPREPIVVRDGTPLYARKQTDQDEWLMLKAGTDDGGKIPLYHRYRKRKMTFEYFIKLAPGEYLELTPEKPTPKDGS
ncbi:MAG TPA: hypothetical protein VNQ90_12935 [Chthoniobacteraceae bacterium]|nr:hypothetical protein [Chthoniobacteraceae bacterium]